MGGGWQLVAFPVILPWREEFWTLPLYFPDLKVGVTPGWPGALPYQGLPLPPEAEASSREFKGLRPGDLKQWQAFKEYRQNQEEREDDLLQAIRQYGAASTPEPDSSKIAWRLAWQLEKMEADQEARLVRVDQGQEWLTEILTPEPWEERPTLGPVPGIDEMVDPELARLRYHLWQQVMAPYTKDHWAPLLLGRTARSLFLTLKGWPQWTGLRTARISLPGCRSEAEFRQVKNAASLSRQLDKFTGLLAEALTKAAAAQEPGAAVQDLQEFAAAALTPAWPFSPPWNWELEVWAPDSGEGEKGGPVLCWAGAGAGVLPG